MRYTYSRKIEEFDLCKIINNIYFVSSSSRSSSQPRRKTELIFNKKNQPKCETREMRKYEKCNNSLFICASMRTIRIAGEELVVLCVCLSPWWAKKTESIATVCLLCVCMWLLLVFTINMRLICIIYSYNLSGAQHLVSNICYTILRWAWLSKLVARWQHDCPADGDRILILQLLFIWRAHIRLVTIVFRLLLAY